jgi:hypothetical protein
LPLAHGHPLEADLSGVVVKQDTELDLKPFCKLSSAPRCYVGQYHRKPLYTPGLLIKERAQTFS